jgi:GT2 family glycosyltransferase
VGVVGPAPIAVDASSPPALRYIAAKFNEHLKELARPGHTFKLRDFYSGNFSIRRGILLEVGGFDESFTAYGNEDVELSYRLAARGVRFVYDPLALAHQHHVKDFAALAQDNIDKGRTSVTLVSKHPETLPDLKLGAYHRVSIRWRILRGLLLTATDLWSGTPMAMVGFMQRLERRGLGNLDPLYNLALDYFYWLCAFKALRENQMREGTTSTAAGAIIAIQP